jgi:hypothetical protein
MKNFTISLGIGLNMLIQEYFTVLSQPEEKASLSIVDLSAGTMEQSVKPPPDQVPKWAKML